MVAQGVANQGRRSRRNPIGLRNPRINRGNKGEAKGPNNRAAIVQQNKGLKACTRTFEVVAASLPRRCRCAFHLRGVIHSKQLRRRLRGLPGVGRGTARSHRCKVSLWAFHRTAAGRTSQMTRGDHRRRRRTKRLRDRVVGQLPWWRRTRLFLAQGRWQGGEVAVGLQEKGGQGAEAEKVEGGRGRHGASWCTGAEGAGRCAGAEVAGGGAPEPAVEEEGGREERERSCSHPPPRKIGEDLISSCFA